jgi:hypothetical protein
VRVTVAGKSYTDPGPSVQVKGIEQQDRVIASLSASSTSVLVEEPFTVTLSVAVAELPDPYAESNEPLHPNLLPQLTADFLEIRQDSPGLKSPDLNQILNNLIDQSGRQPGFAINDYKTRDMSSGFGRLFGDDDPFRPRPIRFRLPTSRVTLNGKKYRAYTLALDYTPTKEGEFTFGPLSFKGTVISDVTADRQAVTRDIYTIGPAVTVRVVPPPDEGRPETFIGSVGKDAGHRRLRHHRLQSRRSSHAHPGDHRRDQHLQPAYAALEPPARTHARLPHLRRQRERRHPAQRQALQIPRAPDA